jgi:hypothetical protein
MPRLRRFIDLYQRAGARQDNQLMQSTHFIDVLTDTYEAAYSAHKGGALTASPLRDTVLETAIKAASCIDANGWPDAARARLVAAALLRARFGEQAQAEAMGLPAGVVLSIVLAAQDPLTKEQLNPAPAAP